jgi:hypothetical protein
LGQILKASEPQRALVCWRNALRIFVEIEDPNAARVAGWIGFLTGPSSEGGSP